MHVALAQLSKSALETRHCKRTLRLFWCNGIREKTNFMNYYLLAEESLYDDMVNHLGKG
jgi:hypothetical protein